MKTVLVILALILTGCAVEVKPYHIVRAQEFCKSHGGIQEFHARTIFGLIDANKTYTVICIDGAWDNVSEEKK